MDKTFERETREEKRLYMKAWRDGMRKQKRMGWAMLAAGLLMLNGAAGASIVVIPLGIWLIASKRLNIYL